MLAVAVRYGELKVGRYTPDRPAILATDCPECKGKREVDGVICRACRGQGKELLTCCPTKIITRDIWRAMEAADFARKGILPVAGGFLDQSASATAAIRLIWDVECPYRLERKMDA